MNEHIKIEWIDSGREPKCPPDPRYPDGIEIDMAADAELICEVKLPYPAQRCGVYLVHCTQCGLETVITTAGRPDDPCSIRLPCRP